MGNVSFSAVIAGFSPVKTKRWSTDMPYIHFLKG
jgi:hypothetical protein